MISALLYKVYEFPIIIIYISPLFYLSSSYLSLTFSFPQSFTSSLCLSVCLSPSLPPLSHSSFLLFFLSSLPLFKYFLPFPLFCRRDKSASECDSKDETFFAIFLIRRPYACRAGPPPASHANSVRSKNELIFVVTHKEMNILPVKTGQRYICPTLNFNLKIDL